MPASAIGWRESVGNHDDWDSIVDMSFPQEVYVNVLIEQAEDEIRERARQLNRELLVLRPVNTAH